MRQKVLALKVREIMGTPRSRCTERKHLKSLFRQDTAARHKGTTQLRSRNKTIKLSRWKHGAPALSNGCS